ncbi:hypothetical protein QZH41_005198 [Actinostola sp. cb2023]|nr:hypothetical protein QZH41_005198 [Actinostola sp. cb2023]
MTSTKREIQKGSSKAADKGAPQPERIRPRGTAFTATASETHKGGSCALCKNTHNLEECKEFLKKTVEDRKSFVKLNNLCFRCLKRGHMVRQCRGRQRCEECKKPHATTLHEKGEQPRDTKIGADGTAEKATSNCTKVCQTTDCGLTCSLIVPVWLHHRDNPEKRTEVYAILDDQSDVCFITENVCEELGLQGPELKLELGTMHAVESVNTQRIDGLVVSRHDKQVEISLPKSYSRYQIPARREQIPRPEGAQQWKHLRHIAKKIPPYREDLKIGILIGNNCVQAIKPRDVIPGKPKDPYAVRTALG